MTKPLNCVELRVVVFFIWSEFSRVLVFFVVKEMFYMSSYLVKVTTLHTY